MLRRIPLLILLSAVYLVSGPFGNAWARPGQPGEGRYELLVLTGQSQQHRQGAKGGGFAVLLFERAAPTFNYRLYALGLQAHQAYTLVYFPAPWPGDNLRCLGHANSNRFGMLRHKQQVDLNSNLPAAYDANHPKGASLRLVLSSDVDCAARRFLDWRPAAYLFGTRLIRYTDTDVTVDYVGRYCMTVVRAGGEVFVNLDLSQSVGVITATFEGFSLTGSVTDGVMTLSGPGPDGLIYTFLLTFSDDGGSFSGTVSTGSETMSATGSKGACFGYVDPPGDPECQLPVADISLVTGGQQFNSVSGTTVHNGLDFQFASPLPTIVAPCDGVVMGITVHPIAWGNLIVDFTIRYNGEWNYLMAFEPYSPDSAIAAQQQAEISVTVGQIVHRGDVLGRLVVPVDSVYPHVHWGVSQGGSPICPRDVLTTAEQLSLDSLYASFGRSPACLPPPP